MTYPNEEQLEMLIKLKPFFKEKMREIKIGDMFYNPFRHKLYFVDKETVIIGGCYVIPLPVDPVNPERGILSMIKGYDVTLDRINDQYIVFVWDNIDHPLSYQSGNPITSLLKALIGQEGL